MSSTSDPSSLEKKPSRLKKWMKRIFVYTIPSLILLFFIITVLLEIYLEGKIVSAIDENTKGHIRISEADLSFWNGSIELEDLKFIQDLENKSEEEVLLRINKLRAVGLWDTLSNNYPTLSEVVIDRPTIYLEKNAENIINYKEFERIIESFEEAEESSDTEDSGSNTSNSETGTEEEERFSIESFVINKPRLIMAHDAEQNGWQQASLEIDSIKGSIDGDAISRFVVEVEKPALRTGVSTTSIPLFEAQSGYFLIEVDDIRRQTLFSISEIQSPAINIRYNKDYDSNFDLLKEIVENLFPEEDEDEEEGDESEEEDEEEKDERIKLYKSFDIKDGSIFVEYEETPFGPKSAEFAQIRFYGHHVPYPNDGVEGNVAGTKLNLEIEKMHDPTVDDEIEDIDKEPAYASFKYAASYKEPGVMRMAEANVSLTDFPLHLSTIILGDVPEDEKYPLIESADLSGNWKLQISSDFVSIYTSHDYTFVKVTEDKRGLLDKLKPAGMAGVLKDLVGESDVTPRIEFEVDIPKEADGFLPYYIEYKKAFDQKKNEILNSRAPEK